MEVVVVLKLHLLLYADDTVILAETPNDLQISLNSMAEYCKNWELSINVTKTQVMTISRGKIRKRHTFYFEEIELVNTDSYKYLGIIFNYNGKFRVTKEDFLLGGKRAMFALITKARKLHLPIDVQLELFDAVVTPVVLYGSEIWGYEGCETLEKLHLQFCKIILCLKKRTCNVMLYGELGRFPLLIPAKMRILSFWARLITSQETKISCMLYKLLYKMHVSTNG